MVNKKVFIAAAIAAAVLLALFYPTEKRKIKRTLKNVSEWVSKDVDATMLSVAAKSKKAGKYFAPKALFAYEKKGIEAEFSLEEIERGYVFLLQQERKFKVGFRDVKIDLGENNAASATLTALVESEGTTFDGLSSVNEISLELQKGDEGWRIRAVKINEVLEK